MNNNTKLPSNLRQTDANACNRETLKSSPTICRLLHCIDTIYNMRKHCPKRNYVQNHININIVIIVLLGCIRYTSDNALGTLHSFQTWYGGSWGQGQGHRGKLPSARLWHRPCLNPLELLGSGGMLESYHKLQQKPKQFQSLNMHLSWFGLAYQRKPLTTL